MLALICELGAPMGITDSLNINIEPEAIVLLGAFISAFVLLMVWMIRHLTAFSQALLSHTEVNKALNQELLQVVQGRQKERSQYEADRNSWRETQSAWRAERIELKNSIAHLTREIQRLQDELSAENAA